MSFLLNRLLNLSAYRTPLTRDRALVAYVVVYVILVGFTFYAVFAPDWYTVNPGDYSTYRPLVEVLPIRPETWLFLGLPYLFGGATLYVLSRGQGALGGAMASAYVYITIVFPVIVLDTVDFSSSSYVVNLFMFALITALINGQRGVLIGFSVAVVSYLLDPGTPNLGFLGALVIQFSTIAMIAYFFLRIAETTRIQTEQQAGVERLKLAEITQRITRLGSQRTSLQQALNDVIDLLLQNYPQFYHAQIFAIDEQGIQARLIASTGDAGRILLARGHGLAVGSLSVIGQTTFRGEPIIAYANQSGTSYRPNDLLNRTKTEVAFPMRIGNQIVGALDFQSYEEVAFSDNDLSAFQSLSDSIALIIDNIRQFETARQRVEENQQLAEQSRNALAEVQRLNKRLIGRAWSEYLRDQQAVTSLELDLRTDAIAERVDWTDTLKKAIHEARLVQEGNIVSVPLLVRGQVIGAMEFELDETGKLTPDDVELLKEISERFGLAAENTRLVEQSQRAAQREALINVVSSRLQTTNNVESTLAEAARSLSELLQADRVSIRLGKPQIATTPLATTTGE